VGEVDLWMADVDRALDLRASMALLDEVEQARAGRFRAQRDRDRFVARHAFLRRVLAGYVGSPPARVGIRITSTGRPELDAPSPIRFNASHSGGVAVVAVASGRQVGVDIERIRLIADAMDLASTHMTRSEVTSLRSAPAGSRSAVFLALWTRKESFVKAVGGGLSIPLDSFDMSVVGDDGSGRPRGAAGVLPFAFAGFHAPHGCVGTVTVEGTGVRIRRSDLEGAAA
jgi:4'-phosphopantetheinyl transferase